jgi:uncharacterized protein YjiK
MLQKIKNRGLTLIGVILLFLSCSTKSEEKQVENTLELINSFSINISEPSGLAINNEGTELYTVSDNTNKIYKLSTTGKVLKTYNYEGNDLEGVSMFTSNKLLLAEERTKEIVVFDLQNNTFNKHKVAYENKDANSGIEGVAFNPNNNTIFILNEKNPGLLIKLNADFSILETYKLKFASDYSGIFYDKTTNNLWIVSDQSKTINKCNLSGKLIESYPISVAKSEGIAVTNNTIYIVSDSNSKLYKFKKPIE